MLFLPKSFSFRSTILHRLSNIQIRPANNVPSGDRGSSFGEQRKARNQVDKARLRRLDWQSSASDLPEQSNMQLLSRPQALIKPRRSSSADQTATRRLLKRRSRLLTPGSSEHHYPQTQLRLSGLCTTFLRPNHARQRI